MNIINIINNDVYYFSANYSFAAKFSRKLLKRGYKKGVYFLYHICSINLKKSSLAWMNGLDQNKLIIPNMHTCDYCVDGSVYSDSGTINEYIVAIHNDCCNHPVKHTDYINEYRRFIAENAEKSLIINHMGLTEHIHLLPELADIIWKNLFDSLNNVEACRMDIMMIQVLLLYFLVIANSPAL